VNEPVSATAEAWERSTELCVSCPLCAFTFDSAHTDADGGYSCPVCAEVALAAALERAERERDEAREALREAGGVIEDVIWLDNNIHNYGSAGWRDFFKATLRDARRARATLASPAAEGEGREA
jgi:hypothetical protein